MRVVLTLSSLVVFASALGAQTTTTVTITNANMVYRQGPLPSASSNLWAFADLRSNGAASTDNLWSLWWYYRVAGDTQEFSFRNDAPPNSPLRMVTAPVIVTSWPDVAGRGLFSASLVEVLVSTGPDRGYVSATMDITNLTTSPLTIDLFSLSDLEAGGSSAPFFNNNVSWGGVRSQYTEVQGSLLPGVEYYCPDADRVQVDYFGPTTPGVLPGMLTDNILDDLGGWGGSFGPGDHNGAFQWQRTIPPLASSFFTVYVAMTGNRPMQSLYGTASPTPSGPPAISTSERAIVDPTNTTPRNYDVQLTNALPGAPALVMTNLATSALVVSGIQVWVDPVGAATRFLVVDAAGAADLTVALPPWSSLYGLALHHQFFVVDPGAPGGLVAWSRGLTQQIGTW